MKKIIVLMIGFSLIGCMRQEATSNESIAISKEGASEPSVASESVVMPEVNIEKKLQESDEKALINETVKLLDDKIIWQKSTDMKSLTGAQFKYNVTTPIDATRKKWSEFKQSPAYKPCEGALTLFTNNASDAMKNQTDKNVEQVFKTTLKDCKAFLDVQTNS